jgi:hypothetical protein
MFSLWQAAWRSAWIVGIALMAFACIQLVGLVRNDIASPPIAILAAALIVGILTLVIAVAFRCGFHLSGLEKGRPLAAIATSVIYLVLLAVLTSIPIETRAIAIDLPTQGQAHHALLMVPAGTLVFVFFVLPLLVSFGVARFIRARASVA